MPGFLQSLKFKENFNRTSLLTVFTELRSTASDYSNSIHL